MIFGPDQWNELHNRLMHTHWTGLGDSFNAEETKAAAVMTELACLVYERDEYLSKLASRLTSLAIIALKGNKFHYDAKMFSLKPHPGQQVIAHRIRSDLLVEEDSIPYHDGHARIQDRYSLRCAPHIIGVLENSLEFYKRMIENELNSVNDNPFIDTVVHGAMFYGGHILFAMDGLKILIANISDLMDRKMALLVDPTFNNGLPANLQGCGDTEKGKVNHGLKGLQISISAWTAEALKQSIPAPIFSRSTECHNQDKVSLGTIAARDCIRVLELTEQVSARLLLALNQALTIRKRDKPKLLENSISNSCMEYIQNMSDIIEFVKEDESCEMNLRKICRLRQKFKD